MDSVPLENGSESDDKIKSTSSKVKSLFKSYFKEVKENIDSGKIINVPKIKENYQVAKQGVKEFKYTDVKEELGAKMYSAKEKAKNISM